MKSSSGGKGYIAALNKLSEPERRKELRKFGGSFDIEFSGHPEIAGRILDNDYAPEFHFLHGEFSDDAFRVPFRFYVKVFTSDWEYTREGPPTHNFSGSAIATIGDDGRTLFEAIEIDGEAEANRARQLIFPRKDCAFCAGTGWRIKPKSPVDLTLYEPCICGLNPAPLFCGHCGQQQVGLSQGSLPDEGITCESCGKLSEMYNQDSRRPGFECARCQMTSDSNLVHCIWCGRRNADSSSEVS